MAYYWRPIPWNIGNILYRPCYDITYLFPNINFATGGIWELISELSHTLLSTPLRIHAR